MMQNVQLICFTGLLLSLMIFLGIKTYQTEDIDTINLINQELMEAPSASGKLTFNLLDATQFTDSYYPWLGYPVTILSEQLLLGSSNNSGLSPNEAKIKAVLGNYKDKKRIILNIPSWRISADKERDVLNEQHLKWYLQVLRWAKEVLPDTDLGIFGLPYSPWLALKSTKKSMMDYQQVNDKLKPILAASDTLYPLFQIYDNDSNDLFYLMGAQLYIAQASGKPVYPIVSHKKIINNTTVNELAPLDFIKQQCTFIRKNAEGLVWWTAKKENWDNSWYKTISEQCFL